MRKVGVSSQGLFVAMSMLVFAACAASGADGGSVIPTKGNHTTTADAGTSGSGDDSGLGLGPSTPTDPGTSGTPTDPDAGTSTPPDPGIDSGTGTGTDTGTGTGTGTGGTTPTSCTDIPSTKGCCSADGTTNYYCSKGTLKTQACASGTVCGWDATKGWYGCVSAPGGADPSGTYPMACGASAGTGTGTSDAGTGTSTDSGTGTGTSDAGTSTSACADPTTTCVDATGSGGYGCFAAGPSFPSSAATCSATIACKTGYSCWASSSTATTGYCVQDCTASGSTGTGTGTSDAGTSSDTGTSSTCGATVSFASTVYPALNSGCARCHSQYGSASTAYKTLTGSTGMGAACGQLVIAGDPTNSPIIGAVQGTGCTNMTYLSSSQITSLSNWICQGAKNN